MTTYNFKRETKVYVVRDGQRYSLDVYPDLSYSQTFNETSVPVKTLHSQFNMFESAVINRANPANFNFTVPILYENDLNILFQLLLDYEDGTTEGMLKTADLYFEVNSEIYKIEKCVIESGVFTLSNSAVMSLNLSGSGRKLSRYIGALPGSLVSRSSTRSFGRITKLGVSIGNVLQPSITAVTFEVRNNINWTDYATIQNSQSVISASETMFPEAFVVSSRALTGTIQQYITDETRTHVQRWSTSTPISVTAGELGKTPLLQFNIPAAVFTNRLETQEIYIQSYDFRMVSNPSSLSTIIIKE
jgi:hypothetical protein